MSNQRMDCETNRKIVRPYKGGDGSRRASVRTLNFLRGIPELQLRVAPRAWTDNVSIAPLWRAFVSAYQLSLECAWNTFPDRWTVGGAPEELERLCVVTQRDTPDRRAILQSEFDRYLHGGRLNLFDVLERHRCHVEVLEFSDKMNRALELMADRDQLKALKREILKLREKLSRSLINTP